jgi:AcrR family transcriptional regulator
MSTMTTDKSPRAGASAARQRVLGTATRLFYSEGVHTIGIDRIIAEAGVAKATFYNHFPSKDVLVRCYIEEQDRIGRASLGALAKGAPRDSLFALFDAISEAAIQPGYRGCPFLNAAAEYPNPDTPVRQAIDAHRRWHRDLLSRLLAETGYSDPDVGSNILLAIWDGLMVSGHVDDPSRIRRLARQALASVIGAD